MKYTILLLSLLTFTSDLLLAEDQNKSCRPSLCHKPKKKKKSCAPTPISHPTTITKSGCYCLTRDIVGTIVIAADNVMLDLNCHLVDGNGAEFALSTSNQHDVTIQNGAVTNAGSLGISVVNCEGAILRDIQIYNSNQAIVLSGCSTSSITAVRAYDNVNTSGALILVDSCDSIQLTDVHANENEKALTVGVSSLDPAVGLLAINNSTNVTCTDCSTNTNKQTNDTSRFAPTAALFSANITFRNHQSNNNTKTVDDTHGFAPIYVVVGFDTNNPVLSSTILDTVQANGNSVGTTHFFFRPIYVADTPGTIITNAQVNDNSVQLLAVRTDGRPVDMSCIFLFTGFFTGLDNNVVSHCQVSGNTVVDAGSGRTQNTGEGTLASIFIEAFDDLGSVGFPGFEGRSSIEYCQATDNIISSSGDVQFIDGIAVAGAEDVTISYCTCNNNSGGQGSAGILIDGFADNTTGLANPCRNVVVSHCTANNCTARDIGVGIFVGAGINFGTMVRSSSDNCMIIDTQANNNSGNLNGAGIFLTNALGCSVINCQTDKNSHNGIFAGKYSDETDPSPFNRDNSIIGCSAKNNGVNGFDLSSTSTNDNFLIENCVALANTGVGFLHENAILTSRYLGNYAKDNGTNYNINGGAIQLFSLDVNGTYTHVTGDPNHFSALVNVEGI